MDGIGEVGTPESGEGHAPRSRDLLRLADAQQYSAEPQPEAAKRGPVVILLNATPDPFGSLAALTAMYTGRVVRSLNELTDDERRAALQAMQSTALNGPLEAVQFHFVIEGVNRSWTHQAVRGRRAFYAQESLRFAVVDDWSDDVPLPPYLAQLGEDHVLSRVYRQGLMKSEDAYSVLVSNGVPAEEARDLLPHAVLTRLHWVCTLRELLHVAGLRTCTQAQFSWRLVMAGVAQALRTYGRQFGNGVASGGPPEGGCDEWQLYAIADALRPVCYQTGRCGFMAAFDRACTIRERVEKNAAMGRPSSVWSQPGHTGDEMCDGAFGCPQYVAPIHDHEWAADPGAARVREA